MEVVVGTGGVFAVNQVLRSCIFDLILVQFFIVVVVFLLMFLSFYSHLFLCVCVFLSGNL